LCLYVCFSVFFFFKQKRANKGGPGEWGSDVGSS
jgi:hypothetical protein